MVAIEIREESREALLNVTRGVVVFLIVLLTTRLDIDLQPWRSEQKTDKETDILTQSMLLTVWNQLLQVYRSYKL